MTPCRLTRLQKLHINQNAVRRLGRSAFRGLGELEVVDLHDNRIDFIEDDAFADLRGLKSLDLSLNIIRSVGDNLDSLPGIMKLNLSDNYITSLGPHSIENILP